MIYLNILIPFLTAIILYVWFKHKTVLWEFLIPIVVSIIVISAFKFGGEASLTRDTEYWNDAIVKVEKFEFWDEEVPCRHDYDCFCSTDSDGNECCCSTCHWHSYDVDDHPEYNLATSSQGWTSRISDKEYNRLVKKLGNKTFVDMRRDYHSTDGDKYLTTWDGSNEDLEYTVRAFDYENRVQASHSVFNYPEVDTSDIKHLGLYENYPAIFNRSADNCNVKRGCGIVPHQQHIIGYKDLVAERKMEILNARLGSKKQLKCFIIVYKNKTRQAGLMQEALWKGGNKNEFIVTIGIDDDNNIKWCYPFSWTEESLLKIEIRNFVKQEQKVLNLSDLADFMYGKLDKNFVRKEFADFSYLKVEPTTSQIVWCFIVTLLVNIGVSIFIIYNNFTDEVQNNWNNRRFRYRRRY